MSAMIIDSTLITSAAKNSLSRLPEELLRSILYSLSPPDAARFGAACKRFRDVAEEPLLWKHYCDSEYDYWKLDSRSVDSEILEGSPNAPWKDHFVKRISRDIRNKALFESLLSTQHERYIKMQEIIDCGYEARPMLVANANAPDDCEDVLARRYHAEAALGSIHRAEALRIWSNLANDNSPHILEEQIAAFDLFVIGKGWGDVRSIMTALDDIAAEIRASYPFLDTMDPVTRATTVVKYLRDNRLVGLDEGTQYRSMKNNYLSFNLLNRTKSSVPLQSAVIYCGVARRLGIDAYPCNYPAHIYVVVLIPRPNPTSSQTSDDDRLYLDPWSQDTPIPLETLVTRLQTFGVPHRDHGEYLDPSNVRGMVTRTCRNIMHSYQDWRRGMLPNEQGIENHNAFYSFLWCMALLEDGTNTEGEGGVWHRPHIAHLPPYFQDNYPEDFELVSKHLTPLFASHPQLHDFQMRMAGIKAGNVNRKPVVPRDAGAKDVKFKIGQMLQHKRYGYTGVIRSWDIRCQADANWMQAMRIDELPKGREQAYYHVLADDKTERYVAEENISPIYTDPPASLLKMGGKFFKRWDAGVRKFISNVSDEFPDD